MTNTFKIPLCAAFLLLGACSSSPTHTRTARETKSIDDAQRAFFPDNWDYTIGDFVLSLPVGYYEDAVHRLSFANRILREATPRPSLGQTDYLILPSDALAPKRHFLLLDQHHMLIYSEPSQLDGGCPALLSVLERDDASWTDVTSRFIPAWALHPDEVQILPSTKRLQLSIKNPARRSSFEWRNATFSITTQSQ